MTQDALNKAVAAAGFAFVPDDEVAFSSPTRVDRPQDARPARPQANLVAEPAASDSWAGWLGGWSVTFRR